MSPDLRIRFVEPLAGISLPRREFRAARAKPASVASREQEEGRSPEDQTDSEQDPGQLAAQQSPPAPPGPPDHTATATPPGRQGPDSAVKPDWAVAQSRFEELMRRIETEVSHLEQRYAQEIRRLEPQLVRLSLAVAAKLLGRAVTEESVDLAALIRDGLARITASMREPKQITIRVGPDHRAAVEEVLAERQDAPGRMRVEVDPELKPFVCEIHCDMRQVSIDLERELERIGDALLGGGGDDG